MEDIHLSVSDIATQWYSAKAEWYNNPKKDVIIVKKSVKLLFIIAPVIAVVFLLCVFSSDKASNGIDSIENYDAIFQSVDELKFYIGDNNFYSTKSPINCTHKNGHTYCSANKGCPWKTDTTKNQNPWK